MNKYATTSRDTASSTDIASSSAALDPFDLERDIPATEEDVKMQRKLHRQPGENLLPHIDELLNSHQFENIRPRRSTSEGWEAFSLE